MDRDRFFLTLASSADRDEPAPARLKSKIYSALIAHQAASGPLLSLAATKAEGGQLCVFESALCALPVQDSVKSMNPCRICHARVLGERFETAPIFWPHCPYSDFHRR